MGKQAIRTNAVIEGIRARKDGSLGFSACTPELNPEAAVAFMSLMNCNVDMLIYPSDESDASVVTVKKKVEGPSPSQRLRNVLFCLWKHEDPLGKGEFELYYGKMMNRIIESIKKRLPEDK